jgi:hypothetical protein
MDSILRQSFRDFEFLIMDDASEDETPQIIKTYKDDRIRYVRNESCLGVANTLNRGLELVHSEFVARMDADDVSVKRRLEWQVQFMRLHSEIAVSGMWVKSFGDPSAAGIENSLTKPSSIKALMLFCNPLYHPVVIMRKACLDEHKLRYDPTFSRCEDYELWIRTSRFFSIGNIGRVGLRWRKHRENVTVTHGNAMTEQVLQLQSDQLKRIGVMADQEQIRFHHAIGAGKRLASMLELKKGELWLNQVRDAMLTTSLFSENGVHEAIGFVWFRLCCNSTPLGPSIISRYLFSDLRKGYHPSARQWITFILSILWHRGLRGTKSYIMAS